jgi:hypothetical protein
VEQVAVGQLHWSAAKYAPLQEWALVNGIADCYLQVLLGICLSCAEFLSSCLSVLRAGFLEAP